MDKVLVFTETVFTPLAPERIFKIADECLLDIRVIEYRKESAAWIYEYEVKGEYGKIEKLLKRIKSIEITYPQNIDQSEKST
jgi:hypothetical protein